MIVILNEETLKALKPIYGEIIDRLWRAYKIEDAEGKREIESMVEQLYIESLRRRVDDEGILLPPPPNDLIQGEYPVGCVLYNGQIRDEFGLREKEWVQHLAVFGRSGSGKTNLVYMLIANLLQKKKPFLIFDWKRNYRSIITENSDFPVMIYTVGNNLVPFHFNPFIPPPKTEPTAWLKKLIEILAKATFVGEGVMFLLQQGLDKLYRESGVYAGDVEQYPTMQDLVQVIQDMSVKGRAANWMASTQRALSALSFGAMGEVLTTQSNASVADILDKPVILELDSLTSTDKIFFIESLLLWIHHYRLAKNETRDEFRHAIFIEEAHHLLKKQTTGSSEGTTDLLLREIRELGEAIVLVDQHPSQTSLQAIGNTYCTFSMNLKSREDVNASSSYLMFDGEQKQYLNRLEVGQAIVKLQGRWTKPFLIVVPHIMQKHKVITDQFIQDYMQAYSGHSSQNQTFEGVSIPVSQESPSDRKAWEKPLSEMEKAFLEDVRKNPLTGVVQRYKRLSLSRRKGNLIKEELQARGIIKPVDILTHQGKVVLLDVNDSKQNAKRNPGLVHEYWRSKVKEYFQKQGYTVIPEYQLPSGNYVDLMIMKDNEKIPVEIESAKSDYIKNVSKNLEAGYERIYVLGTDAEATYHIHARLTKLQAEHPNIFIGHCADVIRHKKSESDPCRKASFPEQKPTAE